MFELSKEAQTAISKATDTVEITRILHEEAERQGATFAKSFEDNFESVNTSTRNGFSRDTSYESAPARDPQTGRYVSQGQAVEKTVTIAGREMHFTADSPEELETAITIAKQTAEAFAPSQPSQEELKAAQEREQLEISRKYDLEVKFRRGEITTEQFLEQSGAVASILKKAGVDLQDVESHNFIQSWTEATEEFLHSPAGADWPGGPRNVELIGLMLNQLGLVDAEDKTAAIAQAYAELKRNGMLFVNEQTPELQTKVALEAARKNLENSHISPAELLAAWNEEVAKQGIDPNDAMIRGFSTTGSGRKDLEPLRGSSLFGR